MMMTRLWAVLVLCLVWIMLWGTITPLNVAGGLLVGIIVVTVFPFPPVNLRGRFRPLRMLILVLRFLADMVMASFQVAWAAIRPAAPPRSALIEVQLISRSDLLEVITGELVSLVPGTLLIELDAANGRMWLHVLDGSTQRKVELARRRAREQEHRVIAAFGSPEEYEASQQQLQEATV